MKKEDSPNMLDDNKIINLFFERSELAIIELARKYGSVCMKIAMNILSNIQDAEECLDDTYYAVWNTVPPQRPKPLSAYVYRIVRNISINRYKYRNADKRRGTYDVCVEELEYCLASSECTEDVVEEKEIVNCIEDFIDSLEPVNQMIFIRRFWYMDSYKDIADASRLREGTVRTRMVRIKSDLRLYLKERGLLG